MPNLTGIRTDHRFRGDRTVKKMKRLQRWGLFLALASWMGFFWLQACGPAGNKKAGDACKENAECTAGLICNEGKCQEAIVPPEARAPIANAGNDQIVKTGEKAELDGSKSVSLEGKTLTYKWTLAEKPKDSKADLGGGDKETSFLTPDLPGTYKIELVVEDDKASETDTVIITAEKDNQAPTADAGSNSRIELGQTVELDGSKSSDPNNDKLSFKWEVVVRPDGSNASLGDNVAEKTDFKPDVLGNYAIRLTVSDGDLAGSATIFVEVVENNPKPEVTKLSPPWGPANAKDFKVVIEGKNFLFGAKAMLDGKEATDLLYQGATKLTATFDLSGVSAGNYDLIVKNPDTKESNKGKFEVKDADAPSITKVNPPLIITGQAIRFTIEGKGFIDGATVNFDGKELTTTYDSETKLFANLDKAPVTGEYDLEVVNPGGKKSAKVKVIVTGVQAIVQDLSLNRVGSDCKKETITVKGQNFLPELTAELVSQADGSKKYPAQNITLNSIHEVELEYDFSKVPRRELPSLRHQQRHQPRTPRNILRDYPPRETHGPQRIPQKGLLGRQVQRRFGGLELRPLDSCRDQRKHRSQ